MNEKQFTTAEILVRLQNLWNNLDSEGYYTRANTVALAMEEITRLEQIVVLQTINATLQKGSK